MKLPGDGFEGALVVAAASGAVVGDSVEGAAGQQVVEVGPFLQVAGMVQPGSRLRVVGVVQAG